jgi:tetratricopeptide (TPR) repeat protein
MKNFVVVLLVACLVSLSGPVAAQSASDKAVAEALFQEGRKLLAAGEHLEAAKKFQASQQLDPGIGTLLYTADAFEKAGMLASAWANFREAQAAAQQARQATRTAIAKERADKLEPRLSKLQVEVGDNPKLEGFGVERNGEAMAAALWGAAMPLDAASYEIVASAAGYEMWSQTVDVTQEGITKTVTVPALIKKKAEPPAPLPEVDLAGEEGAPASTTPDDGADRGGASTGYKATAVTLAVLGVAGLGVGAYFGLDAKGKYQDTEAACDAVSCDSQGAADLTSQALASSHVATVSFAVGGVALASGALMWALAPSGAAQDTAAKASNWQLLPTLAHDGGGLWFGGSW